MSSFPTVHQDVLVQHLRVIIPHDSPHVNARKQTQFKYSEDGTHYLELDVWFPKLNICFEFQDNYHYLTTWYNQKSLLEIQQNDDSKRDKIQRTGMSIVIIPCWWNGDIESLRSTIHFYRPDICDSSCDPIPQNPPANFYQSIVEIPNVGELMYASFPTNESSLVLEKWWLGEKYDGLRFCWNPFERKLFTRYANEIQLLPSYFDSLPYVFIDGEVWFGRSSFSFTTTLVKNTPQLPWELLRLVSFDCPANSMQSEPFEYRYSVLLSNASPTHSFLQVVARYLCDGVALDAIVQSLVREEGEGIIMRKAESLYEHGRSDSLVKMKSIYGDSEGVVVGIKQKSVYLQLSNGVTFRVPPENVNVAKLSVGDVVSFTYESHTRQSVVVNPKISRVRHDVPWQSAEEQGDFPSNTSRSGAMRLILENFAAKNNLDSLVANTWYSLSASNFSNDKKAKAVLTKFGSYVHAVTSLFPEIEFNKNKFQERRVMSNMNKRRKYFERYAKENGIDPLKPEDWYSHRPKMLAVGKIGLIVNYYNGSIASALVDIFPEIGLEKSQLMYSASAMNKKPNRRKFLEKYAHENGFDPLVPNNWYKHSKKAITMAKGMRGVLWYHANSVSQALIDLFPDIGLDKTKLERFLWKKAQRRQFFENYAKSRGFDPLNPENWYTQSKAKIQALKGSATVLWHHSSSISRALLDLFPEIGLDEARLRSTAVWTPERRRKFFEGFAAENAFDPLSAENWYTRSQNEFTHLKGIARVLWYHGNNVVRALVELFPDVPFNKAKLMHSMANTNVQKTHKC